MGELSFCMYLKHGCYGMDATKLGSRKKQLINYDPLLGDTEVSTVVARRL